MRVVDFGKVAATFVDTELEKAVRIVPRSDARQKACQYAIEARNKWEAQLLGYQRMPALELLSVQSVQLKMPLESILSRPGKKAICDRCGEEILNEREVILENETICRACAGQAYYSSILPEPVMFSVPWGLLMRNEIPAD